MATKFKALGIKKYSIYGRIFKLVLMNNELIENDLQIDFTTIDVFKPEDYVTSIHQKKDSEEVCIGSVKTPNTVFD